MQVSSLKCGLLPLCTEAIAIGELTVIPDYVGSLPDAESREQLTRSLGPTNKVLLLNNHGIVVGGNSIDEAFLLAHNVMTAVEAQVRVG